MCSDAVVRDNKTRSVSNIDSNLWLTTAIDFLSNAVVINLYTWLNVQLVARFDGKVTVCNNVAVLIPHAERQRAWLACRPIPFSDWWNGRLIRAADSELTSNCWTSLSTRKNELLFYFFTMHYISSSSPCKTERASLLTSSIAAFVARVER